MVLSSQIARPDVLRRFATTRRRRHGLRNTIIGAALVAVALWVIWPGDRLADVAPNDGLPGGNDERTLAAAGLTMAGKSMTPPAVAPDITAALAAEKQKAIDAAKEHEAFMKRLRGEVTSLTTPTTATTPSATPAKTEAIAKLFEPAKVETPKVEAGKTEPGKVDAAKVEPVKVDPIKPVVVEHPLKPVVKAEVPVLAAVTGAASTGPAVAEMVGRLNLTTPATPGSAGATLRQGMNLIGEGKIIEGRKMLSRVLTSGDPSVTASDALAIRDTLASVNKSIVFTDRTLENDPLVEMYTIVSGDLLSTIARKYKVTYQFLEQINSVDAKRIRVGQKIKVIKGPFHAVVDKSDYRMDVFAKDTDGASLYITSFSVGVGKDDSTPIGSFICRSSGKVINPSYTHPRTGKFYAAEDPENPVGEHWIALEGTDEHTKGIRGYAIHGTIDPASIGKQASLGCVRMLAKDVEQVYKLLVDGQSTVVIQP